VKCKNQAINGRICDAKIAKILRCETQSRQNATQENDEEARRKVGEINARAVKRRESRVIGRMSQFRSLSLLFYARDDVAMTSLPGLELSFLIYYPHIGMRFRRRHTVLLPK